MPGPTPLGCPDRYRCVRGRRSGSLSGDKLMEAHGPQVRAAPPSASLVWLFVGDGGAPCAGPEAIAIPPHPRHRCRQSKTSTSYLIWTPPAASDPSGNLSPIKRDSLNLNCRRSGASSSCAATHAWCYLGRHRTMPVPCRFNRLNRVCGEGRNEPEIQFVVSVPDGAVEPHRS